jgi:type IV pilus assembly protein PilB
MTTPKQADASQSQTRTSTPVAEPPSTRARLRAALAQPRVTHRRPLGELLTEAGSIHDTGIRRGLILQGNEPDARLGELLLKAGEIHPDELYRALGEQLGVIYVRLAKFDVEPAALAALPQEIVRAHRLLPLMFNEGRLVVACADPRDNETISTLRLRSQHAIELVLANPSEIDESIAGHYAAVDNAASALETEQILQQQGRSPASREEPTAGAAPYSTGGASSTATAPATQETQVVRLVDGLLQNAVRRRASALHFRSLERCAEARYRIDGSLRSAGEFDRALVPSVVSRIKLLANMDAAEQGLPQEGSLRLNTPSGPVDMRISIIPALYGTNIVIRVLDRSVGLRTLGDIGLQERDQKRFTGLLDRGLVLVAGPAGAGKTTTLYAALQELNTGERNIVTLEDPVDYRVDGTVQIQALPDNNSGFAQAFRSILRHDPDVILVGEIHDPETAKTAMDTALAGHLVLSALHTNSATATVTRLIEMGIPPYLVSAALTGVLAQRLVRRNCEQCRDVEEVPESLRATIGVGDDEIFWRSTGCKDCGGTGFSGRVAVYELLVMTHGLRELVSAGASPEVIEARAIEEGMTRLPLQALTLARSGIVSLAEVVRARLG